ncbi:MAG TPA: KpsF/GutQ family sugar-phosphate isomerase [Rhodocyclaceae bacterium]|nr:KpsF/GutQ family sugar-phosphate isomerase [Rhodocyclaceae bacterium]
MSTPATPDLSRTIAVARAALRTEANAVLALIERIDGEFSRAVGLILESHGRVIVSGVGKTGHIGRKIAATLASTGTPSYFVHASEAAHSDLGMITREDVMIAISNSGKSDELLTIVPLVKRQGGKVIAITGNASSPLALDADVHLDASVAEEACPLNLAPTASTTAALAMGDALAVALLDARGFSEADFARSHPGGSLGRRLLTHVRDVMRPLEAVPVAAPSARLGEAIVAMSKGGLGLIAVIENQRISGIFTDGDLRRAFEKNIDLRDATLAEMMTRAPRTIGPEPLAVEAVELMERHRVNALLVADADGQLLGALNMHDLFRAKVV